MRLARRCPTHDSRPSTLMSMDAQSLRILFVGGLGLSSRGAMAARAMADLGHRVHTVSSEVLDEAHERVYFRDPVYRALAKLGIPPDRAGVNEQLHKALGQSTFDLVWVSKSLALRPALLELARRKNPDVRLAFHSEDDMFARHNQSLWFRRALPLYDVVFTHKSYNANPEELPALGARRVVMVDKCFDRHLHRPVTVDSATRKQLGAEVGFIGTFERERAEMMLRLAQTGIAIRVWGGMWEDWVGKHPLMRIEGRALTGADYVKAIACTDVNLGFLRRQNRDLQTDRSLEIPACGAFLLAERTAEHLHLFEEGSEAEFFTDFEELARKIDYFREQSAARIAIARRGRERCLKSGYSFHDRLGSMLRIAMGRNA